MRHRLKKAVPSLHHSHASYPWWVLANIMIGTFMAVLEASIVNVALSKIMATSGISLDVAQWISTAYMMAFAVMLPTSGWIADHLGYKKTYALGMVIFTFFSFMCGISWNEQSLIFFRILQGAGGGLLQPVGMAIIVREFKPEKRGMALGFWGIAAAVSISLGPMLGGYLVDNFDWHIIFLINVPVGIVSLFATWIILREYKTQQTRAFDYAGLISMSVFLSFLLVALASGNAQWNSGGWTDNFMLLCYALTIIGLVVFLIIEFNVKQPLVNLRLLGHKNFGMTNLVMLIFGIGMFGSTFLLPLYLQNALGYTALQSGIVFLPVGILQAFCSTIGGLMSDRMNPKIPLISSIIIFAFSFYLNSRLSLSSEHAQIMLPLYLRGASMGFLFTSLSTMSLVGISQKDMAQASGLMNVMRQIGGSLGVAFFQTLLTQRIVFHREINGTAVDAASSQFTQIQHGIQAHAQTIAGMPLSNAIAAGKSVIVSHISMQSYVQGINDDFLIAAFCTIICIIPVLILKNPRKHKQDIRVCQHIHFLLST